VNLSVQDPDEKIAAKIANKTAEVFKTEIVKIMSVDNVSILAKAAASDNPSPIKPRPIVNIAIALVFGLMAGVGIAFFLEYLDNTVKTEQEIEKLIGAPILGVIATMDDFQKKEKNHRHPVKNSRLRGETVGR
jgi:capsular polysaccharide biosynthesis protein